MGDKRIHSISLDSVIEWLNFRPVSERTISLKGRFREHIFPVRYFADKLATHRCRLKLKADTVEEQLDDMFVGMQVFA